MVSTLILYNCTQPKIRILLYVLILYLRIAFSVSMTFLIFWSSDLLLSISFTRLDKTANSLKQTICKKKPKHLRESTYYYLVFISSPPETSFNNLWSGANFCFVSIFLLCKTKKSFSSFSLLFFIVRSSFSRDVFDSFICFMLDFNFSDWILKVFRLLSRAKS